MSFIGTIVNTAAAGIHRIYAEMAILELANRHNNQESYSCQYTDPMNLTAANVSHHGDSIWGFTSDYETDDGKPCRLILRDNTNSFLDYGVADLDALYFEKGLIIYLQTDSGLTLLQRASGGGSVKIPDFYHIESYYKDGVLGLFFETPLMYDLDIIDDIPHEVPEDDVMFRIWTLARGIVYYSSK